MSKTIAELISTVTLLTNRLEKSEAELEISKTVTTRLAERVDSLEKKLENNERTSTNNAQYLRRRQLEVTCTKADLKNGPNLKQSVARML